MGRRRSEDCRKDDHGRKERSMPSRSALGCRSTGVLLSLMLLLASTAVNAPDERASAATTVAFRAFSDDSLWNTRIPAGTPATADSRSIIRFLSKDNSYPYIRLAGTGSDGHWGIPIYWADASSRRYSVVDDCSMLSSTLRMPPEFASVRIPTGASPAPTSDSNMVVYDPDAGMVYGFWKARYDGTTDTWYSCGGSVYYLASNGLDGSLPQSNNPANTGHRGAPPPIYVVREDEVASGEIDHVLRISVAHTCGHVFPMTADEGCSTGAPPEGTRIRIKPSIDLSALHLSPAARIVARALKRYGAVITDRSGGAAILGVEDTVTEGRGWLWHNVLAASSLSAIPFRMFKVVK
jgi:hypothetical protein